MQQSRSTQADKQGEEEEKEKWHDLKIPLKPHTATQQWHEDSFRDYKEWKFASVPLQSMSLFPVTKTRLNSEMFVCCSDLLFPNSSQVIHRSTAPPPFFNREPQKNSSSSTTLCKRFHSLRNNNSSKVYSFIWVGSVFMFEPKNECIISPNAPFSSAVFAVNQSVCAPGLCGEHLHCVSGWDPAQHMSVTPNAHSDPADIL